MRVVFCEDAVQDEASWGFLDRIIYKIEDEWHEWEIDNPEIIEQSDWLYGLRKTLRELFEKAAIVGSYPRTTGPHLRRIVVTLNPQQGEFIPRQAEKYTAQPLFILMENRFTDGLFLNTILDVLSPEALTKLIRRTDGAIIEYDSPGGNGELPKLVESYVSKAAKQGIPVRIIVFTDSDGYFPGDCADDARRVADACRAHGISYCILHKRTIENYIPDEVLLAWGQHPNKKPMIAAFMRLNREQRDYFPMKKGLAKLDQYEAALYQSVDVNDFKELQRGFLKKNIIELLKPHRAALSAGARRGRDGNGELDGLARMIADEL